MCPTLVISPVLCVHHKRTKSHMQTARPWTTISTENTQLLGIMRVSHINLFQNHCYRSVTKLPLIRSLTSGQYWFNQFVDFLTGLREFPFVKLYFMSLNRDIPMELIYEGTP